MGSKLKFIRNNVNNDLKVETIVESQLVASVAKTFERGLQILRKKNHDYASAEDNYRNFSRSEVLGVSTTLAIMIRLEDKISRIENLLLKDRYVTEETVDDTILDAINYLAILKARLEFEREEEPSKQITDTKEIESTVDTPERICPVCKKIVEKNEMSINIHATMYHEQCYYERKR